MVDKLTFIPDSETEGTRRGAFAFTVFPVDIVVFLATSNARV